MYLKLSKLLVAFMLMCGVARAQEVTVAALGDSLTQGFGLVEAEGFVPQLQGWLDGQGVSVRVINAGVSGDTDAARSQDGDGVVGNGILYHKWRSVGAVFNGFPARVVVTTVFFSFVEKAVVDRWDFTAR